MRRTDYNLFIGGEIVEVRGGEINGQTACVRGNSASTHVLNNVSENAPQTMAGGSDKVFVGGERVDN